MSEAVWAIDLRGVAKTYNRKIRALRGVDIRVGRGEIFGLLGPNGAGKSTLVKIMMTVVLPDAAEGAILGQRLGHKPTLGRVGYLPEGHRFPPYLTGRKVLDFYGQLSRVSAENRVRQTAYWLERLGMSKWANTRISQYSKGMMQRVGLAQALLHEPDLVLLDEPTDGIDPLGRKEIREILLEMKTAGKTVFINSHILSELEMVCDRVAILVGGQVARQGTVRDLTAHSISYQVTTVQPVDGHKAALEKLGAAAGGQVVTIQGHEAAAVNKLIDYLRAHQIMIHSVQPKRWSLEDVFVDAAAQMRAKGE